MGRCSYVFYQDKLTDSACLYLCNLVNNSHELETKVEGETRVWEEGGLGGCGGSNGGLEEINCVQSGEREEKAARFQL